MKTSHRILRSLAAFVITGAVALPLLYFIAITVAPARTSDGHSVMPIGQAAFAIIFAPLLACIAAWRFGRAPRA